MLTPVGVHLLPLIIYQDQQVQQTLDGLHPWSTCKYVHILAGDLGLALTIFRSTLNENNNVFGYLLPQGIASRRKSLRSGSPRKRTYGICSQDLWTQNHPSTIEASHIKDINSIVFTWLQLLFNWIAFILIAGPPSMEMVCVKEEDTEASAELVIIDDESPPPSQHQQQSKIKPVSYHLSEYSKC